MVDEKRKGEERKEHGSCCEWSILSRTRRRLFIRANQSNVPMETLRQAQYFMMKRKGMERNEKEWNMERSVGGGGGGGLRSLY